MQRAPVGTQCLSYPSLPTSAFSANDKPSTETQTVPQGTVPTQGVLDAIGLAQSGDLGDLGKVNLKSDVRVSSMTLGDERANDSRRRKYKKRANDSSHAHSGCTGHEGKGRPGVVLAASGQAPIRQEYGQAPARVRCGRVGQMDDTSHRSPHPMSKSSSHAQVNFIMSHDSE